MGAKMTGISTFGGIPDHGAKSLLGILNVCLVIAPDAVTQALVVKAGVKLPASFLGHSADKNDQFIVEGLLMRGLAFCC